MSISSHAQWVGLGFAPFSLPEYPLPFSDRQSSFATEWATGFSQEEHRTSPRRSLCCDVLVTDPTWWETENPLPVRGECVNLSDDGLYAIVPVGYGWAIGQRYRFQLRHPNGEIEPFEPQLGIIVRMDTVPRGGSDHLAIGVRLQAAESA